MKSSIKPKFLAIDNSEQIDADSAEESAILEYMQANPSLHASQIVLIGQSLPSAAIMEQFSKNDSNCMLQQNGNKVVMIQDECWVDGRVNEALKVEERMKPMSVRVSMVGIDQMKTKAVELIRKNLAKSKTDTFLRKPILVFARTNDIAA